MTQGKTVFVVCIIDNGHQEFVGVFTTQEKAQAKIDGHYTNYYQGCELVVYEETLNP